MKGFIIATVLGASLFTGCKQTQVVKPIACDLADQTIQGASRGIANALGCENAAAIAATIRKPITDLKVCENTTPQGTLGDLVCPSAVNFIVQNGISNLPAEWKCSGGKVGQVTSDALITACKSQVKF